jgi:hypothetical protein
MQSIPSNRISLRSRLMFSSYLGIDFSCVFPLSSPLYNSHARYTSSSYFCPSRYNFNNILTCRPVARQRFRKHFLAAANTHDTIG